MKRCPGCNVIYESHADICPTCGDVLIDIEQMPQPDFVPQADYIPQPDYIPRSRDHAGFAHMRGSGIQANNGSGGPAYTFAQRRGDRIIINGAIAESNTQQYYQSKLTKIIYAVFFGEPYQLSHTSFATLFRVEEHTQQGYPEQAADITLYGNMQNVFAVGDDVTVTVKRRGSRMVAKRVFNHTINDYVRVQSCTPAAVIRVLSALAVFVCISIVNGIMNANYYAIGAGLLGLVSSLMPLIIIAIAVWYFGRKIFRKR